MRYKLPQEEKSRLIELAITDEHRANQASESLVREAQFATAVAAFGQLLKGSKFINDFSYGGVIALAQSHKGDDEFGCRTEFVQLVRKAKLAQPL